MGEMPRVDRTQLKAYDKATCYNGITNAQAKSQKQWPLAAPMRLPMPVFHPCRGRGALPRASGNWRETFPRCTRGASLEEQKVQQEHKKISRFRSSGSSQARAQVKKKRSGARQAGRLMLELIQTQMTQKPMLRAKVHARALRASQKVKRAEVWVDISYISYRYSYSWNCRAIQT